MGVAAKAYALDPSEEDDTSAARGLTTCWVINFAGRFPPLPDDDSAVPLHALQNLDHDILRDGDAAARVVVFRLAVQ